MENKEVRPDGKLTPRQIENWRRVLLGLMGPDAGMMTDEDIQALKDKMQSGITQIPKEESCTKR